MRQYNLRAEAAEAWFDIWLRGEHQCVHIDYPEDAREIAAMLIAWADTFPSPPPEDETEYD